MQRRLHQHKVAKKQRQGRQHKRRQHTKNYQPLFWDDERKKKIRADRAAKKLSNAEALNICRPIVRFLLLIIC